MLFSSRYGVRSKRTGFSDQVNDQIPVRTTYRQQNKRLDSVGHRVKVVLLGRLEPLLVVLDVAGTPTGSGDLSATRSHEVETGAFEEVPRGGRSGVGSVRGTVGNSIEDTSGLYGEERGELRTNSGCRRKTYCRREHRQRRQDRCSRWRLEPSWPCWPT